MINVENSKIQNPLPFRVFCQKVIPLAFDESMSYLELLYALLHYLKETVIPAVNNNADAVEELQNLYAQLKSYVDNYFDNLDVQEEINNKLDKMAEDGTLQEIISAYLNSKAIFGFDNVEEMKKATNLIDGSYAITYGYYHVNDDGSGLYKIRNVTNKDDVDGGSLIALNNTNLVAELIIKNNTINVKQFGAYGDGVHDDSQAIQNAVNIANKIYIPNGTYLLNSTISISKEGYQKIYGNYLKTIIKVNTNIYAITIENAKDKVIEKLSFEIEKGGAIQKTKSTRKSGLFIHYNHIKSKDSENPQIDLHNISEIKIIKNTIVTNLTTLDEYIGTGIKITAGVNIDIKQNTIIHYKYGLLYNNDATITEAPNNEGNFIIDNLFFENTYQIYGDTPSQNLGFIIQNNMFDYCIKTGIEYKCLENAIIQNNYFGIYHNTTIAMKLITSPYRNQTGLNISDNVFRGYYINESENANNPCIQINENNNSQFYAEVIISRNTATVVGTFLKAYKIPSAIITDNNISFTSQPQMFINEDNTDNDLFIANNNNTGNVVMRSKGYIKNNNGIYHNTNEIHQLIKFNENINFETKTSRVFHPHITNNGSDVTLTIMLHAINFPTSEERYLKTVKLKGGTYTSFDFVVPAGFYPYLQVSDSSNLVVNSCVVCNL